MDIVIDLLEPLRRLGVKLGPYVLLELLLPGGTLFALLLFLHQRLKAHAVSHAVPPASPLVLVSAVYLAPSPCDRVAWSSRLIRDETHAGH